MKFTFFFAAILSFNVFAQEVEKTPSHADTEKKFMKLSGAQMLESIEQDIEDMSHSVKKKRPSCSLEEFPDATEVIFAFEGAMGYCPADFGFQTPDETGLTLLEKISTMMVSYGNPKEDEMWKKLNRLFFGEVLKNCNLSVFIQYAHQREEGFEKIRGRPRRFSSKKVFYYPWTDGEEAQQCLKKLRSEGYDRPVSILGFSLGGYTAAQFAQRITQDGETIKKMLTLDPVKHGMDSLTSVFSRGKLEHPLSVAGINAESWDNYYQRLDKRTLLLAGIRGRSFVEAHRNIEVKDEDFQKSEIVRKYAAKKGKSEVRVKQHAEFAYADIVIDAIIELIYGAEPTEE